MPAALKQVVVFHFYLFKEMISCAPRKQNTAGSKTQCDWNAHKKHLDHLPIEVFMIFVCIKISINE